MNDRTLSSYLSQLLTTGLKSKKRLLPSTAWELGKIAHAFGPVEKTSMIEFIKAQYLPTFNKSFLNHCLKIYRQFPMKESVSNQLSIAHYQLLIRFKNEATRYYYHKEAIRGAWTVAQLSRQINSRFYERVNHAHAQIIKDEYVFEFTQPNEPENEQQLETALIEKLEDFLLELGSGFAFVARQKRIITESGKSLFIDLVFYHYQLRCFVLFELKTTPLCHRDIGQLDGYVRYFNEHYRQEGDNETTGVLLCTEKDHTIIRYSIMEQQENHLHAATYQCHLPNELK